MTSSVLVAIRVAASPQLAFDVFTQEIGAWWRPSGLFETTPRGDGVMAFEGGEGGRLITTVSNGHVFEIGRITAWEPGSRLAFTWRQASFTPDQITDVEVTFEPVGEETRVSVRHNGWSEIPREHVARHGFPEGPFLQRTAEWWQGHLRALRERLAGRP